MLKQPSQKTLQELSSLARGEVVRWLRGSLDAVRTENDGLEGVAMYRNQGQAQLLSQFLKFVDGSDGLLNNIERNKDSTRGEEAL